MKMPSNLMQLRVLAFSLVLIIVPFIVFYYFWVSNQTRYFNGRNLRILATLGTHLQESVESQGSVFKNAAEKYAQDLAEGRFDENGRPVTAANKAGVVLTIKQLKEKDYTAHFQEHALDPFKGDGANLQAASVTVVSKSESESLPATPRIEVKDESTQRWLYFEYTVPYTPVSSNASTPVPAVDQAVAPSPTPTPQPEYLNFKGKINLAQLVGPFVNKREIQENQGALYQDGFDAVLLAGLDEQMTILFQESSAKLRLLSLSNLTTSTGAKVDLKLLGQSTNITDVRLGPADYKLFVQPIQLPLVKTGTNSESIRWLGCGLVENAHFQQQRLAVSYNVLIAFGFITVLIAVSWWFLKLLFIGPKDRFRALDAYMLGFSAFMIAALLTLAALFTYSYTSTVSAGEENLEKFSGSIKSNFYSELDGALRQIDELNRKLDQQTLDAAKKVNARNLDKLAFRSSIMRDGVITPESPYPYLNTAFWMNEQGWQQIKWTVRSGVTNRVNVSNRAYYYRLRQGRSYSYNGHQFWIDQVTSTTTGAHTVVISKLMTPHDTTSWISAIDMKMLSLMQPVIPEGFGFAVIDDNGKVLFHSAPKLHLGENFFEECDNNQVLRAAVLGRWRQGLTTSYFGKGNSLYVEPLGDLPWTIVVFNEKDSLRTTFSEILSLCLVLFLSYVLALSALLLAIYVINRFTKDRSTWIWPDKNKRDLYVHSLIVNSALFLLSCFAVYVLPGLWRVFLPTAIGLLAVALSVWRFKRLKSYRKQLLPNWFDHRTAYVVNVTLLFCLASVLPAYACFKIAYIEEIKLFIKHGQLALADDMMTREDRIRNQFRSTYRYTPPNEQTANRLKVLVDNRIKEKRDVYDSFFYKTRQYQQPAPAAYVNARPSRLLRFFKGFVPLFDHSSIKRHALTTRAVDDSWSWDGSAGTTLVLHAREPQRNGQPPLERHIESIMPRLSRALWWWMLLPLAFIAVSLLVLYMIRQLFPFALEDWTSDELKDFRGDSASPNLMVVLSPHFIGKRELLEQMQLNGAHRIDLERGSRLKTWLRRVDLFNPQGRPVVLENFEYGIDDVQHNRRKLFLLKALRKKKRMTVALSTVEPEVFWSVNGKNAHTNGDTKADTNGNSNGNGNGAALTLPVPMLCDRWSDAVSRFLKVAPRDLGDADSFRRELNDTKKRLLAREGVDKATKDRIVSAFDLIDRECSPRAYLQNVGLAIANQSRIGKVSTENLCKQIVTNAKPYYTAVWNACTGEEKLTLTRLAQHGLLSPKDPDTEELMMKGLILRDPAIRLMNESFRLFILSMRADNAVARCEKEAKSSSNWEVLKVPLTIGLLSVAAFLLLTQRELYNSAVPFITGLAAGLPSLLKLMSIFQGSGAKAGG